MATHHAQAQHPPHKKCRRVARCHPKMSIEIQEVALHTRPLVAHLARNQSLVFEQLGASSWGNLAKP